MSDDLTWTCSVSKSARVQIILRYAHLPSLFSIDGSILVQLWCVVGVKIALPSLFRHTCGSDISIAPKSFKLSSFISSIATIVVSIYERLHTYRQQRLWKVSRLLPTCLIQIPPKLCPTKRTGLVGSSTRLRCKVSSKSLA